LDPETIGAGICLLEKVVLPAGFGFKINSGVFCFFDINTDYFPRCFFENSVQSFHAPEISHLSNCHSHQMTGSLSVFFKKMESANSLK
jgi:hypothetical protein